MNSKRELNITVFYVGTSLLAPLRQAEREINRGYKLDLHVAAYNFGASLTEDEWLDVERDMSRADVIFVIHVMDGENASRLLIELEKYKKRPAAVIVINCMPELMRRTRMGRLDFGQMFRVANNQDSNDGSVERRTRGLAARVGAWMGEQARSHAKKRSRGSHTQYLKLVDRLPGLLRLVPNAGKLRDIKHYLYLFCYFLQPTPSNIRSMLLYALKHYVTDARLQSIDIKVPPPETVPSVAIYHPDAPALFESFAAYRKWYARRTTKKDSKTLQPEETIGLLLMRPQIVSGARSHYDHLIRAIEAEGLAVIPVLSTLMDNREACEKYFVEDEKEKGKGRKESDAGYVDNTAKRARVSQIISLTGFSFVGGPAMNDSEAAARYLRELNLPLRSVVSLDTQTIDTWRESGVGLNPVQAGMQVAIPELDGATEPFVFGGIPAGGCAPVPLEERCERLAKRIRRWNRLQRSERATLRLAMVVYCFPPNKGNIGTAAELDVFESVWQMLGRLRQEGYAVEVPTSADEVRERLLDGNSESFGGCANVAYRMRVDEYMRLCPHVEEIEKEWGAAPGEINSFGDQLLIQGAHFGNVFVGVQPSFGYEGDPMRLLMAQSGAPHHGFMAFYTYMEKVFRADALLHIGTHGAMEFMPGKQVGLSESCWPDRLTNELPNIYIYSVNNPSEGTIAKRRSYAELVSYLTPPIENAGLYKDLAALKELLTAYRYTQDEQERAQLYTSIEEIAGGLSFAPEKQFEKSASSSVP
ncbi:MAG TPA: cobaltochelatase subunit CobN [Pyrinomonadaceae bacterium]|jgi:magnesium chelatase subunit H